MHTSPTKNFHGLTFWSCPRFEEIRLEENDPGLDQTTKSSRETGRALERNGFGLFSGDRLSPQRKHDKLHSAAYTAAAHLFRSDCTNCNMCTYTCMLELICLLTDGQHVKP